MAKTVIALFDDLRHAHAAVSELRNSNKFTNRDITLMAHDADNRYSRYLKEHDVEVEEKTGDHVESGAATGAGIGAVVGGLAGFLVGTGLLFIPGLGPVLAAGPLASTLLGIAGGAVTGGIVGGLIGLGIPETEAHSYAEGLRRGGTIVLLRADEEYVDDAADIMGKHNPVDIEKRSALWREHGWSGKFEPNDDIYTSDRISTESSSYGNTTTNRIPTYDYREHDDHVANYFTMFEPDYREHYKESTGSVDYDKAQQGYRFGTKLGADSRYAKEKWNAVEAQAHKLWAQESDSSWDSFKHYVKFAWYKTKEELWDASTMYDAGHDRVEVGERTGDRTETTGNIYSRHEKEFRDHYATHPSSNEQFDSVSPAYRVGASLGRKKRYAYEDWNRVRAEAHKKWADSISAKEKPFDKVEEYIKYGWYKTKEELWDASTRKR